MMKFFKNKSVPFKKIFFTTLSIYSILLSTKVYAGDIEGQVFISDNKSSNNGPKNQDHSNAVIYLTGGDISGNSNNKTHSLIQENKQFKKRVMAITRGDSVKFKNSDSFYHNVWSLSKSKTFDLGSFKSPMSKTVKFDKAGLIKVFCNIHPQMISSILVLPNPKYTITNQDGKFIIKNIPNGKYKLRVWVEGAKPLSQNISVTNDKIKNLKFEINRKLRSVHHLNKNGQPYTTY
jgi:plastocyanin